ncbi:MAG: efflux RND transporter periplasmic adaptor subunit, partial [Hyphomicrobiaceae bacterium]
VGTWRTGLMTLFDAVRRALQVMSFAFTAATAAVIVLALVAVMAVQLMWSPAHMPSRYVTAPVTIGDLTVRVTATGTLEPIRIVEVSTELSGTIKAVHVDNNDRVVAGQLLAELESSTVVEEHNRARAGVEVVKAKLREAEFERELLVADETRKGTLARRGITSERDMQVARADARRVGARIEALKAELQVAEADHRIAATRLSKIRIVSPIDGIILWRNIEPGQTVAASLSAPVLFRLAQDLDNMQVRVDVDEADAMRVRADQPATFQVHALRQETLNAKVKKVYLGPEIVNGVVSYKAILSFDNSAMQLKPGMTANADIEVETTQAARLVPNAAFRFVPPAAERVSAPSAMTLPTSAVAAGFVGVDAANPQATQATASLLPDERRLFVERKGEAVAVNVRIGATDGTLTEIRDGSLREGDRVIVDLAGDGGS